MGRYHKEKMVILGYDKQVEMRKSIVTIVGLCLVCGLKGVFIRELLRI